MVIIQHRTSTGWHDAMEPCPRAAACSILATSDESWRAVDAYGNVVDVFAA